MDFNSFFLIIYIYETTHYVHCTFIYILLITFFFYQWTYMILLTIFEIEFSFSFHTSIVKLKKKKMHRLKLILGIDKTVYIILQSFLTS